MIAFIEGDEEKIFDRFVIFHLHIEIGVFQFHKLLSLEKEQGILGGLFVKKCFGGSAAKGGHLGANRKIE